MSLLGTSTLLTQQFERFHDIPFVFSDPKRTDFYIGTSTLILSYIFSCINDWFVRRIWYEIYVMTNNQNQFSEQSPLFFSKECTGLKLGMYLIAKVGSNLI